LAAIGPAPVEIAPLTEQAVAMAVAVATAEAAPAPAPAFEAPLIKAPEEPAKAAVKLALAEREPVATKKAVSGTHLVQLGAFSSNANAQAAWKQFQKKYGVLQGFESASSSVTVNGKKLVRLAASGFGNKAAANAACTTIRANGGDCIVRSIGGETAPVRMAARKTVRVAAR
jgi:cell division protein FtsN